MSRFFEDINNYDLLFIEDPHFSSETQLEIIEITVYNGTPLFISEHFGHVSNPFGMIYNSKCSDADDATVIETDPLISFNIGDELEFAERPCLDGSLKKIATYDGTSYAAISKINYGDGYVFYYSDFDAELEGSSENFKTKVIENLNLTAQYIARYQKPVFEITERILSVQNIDNIIYLDQTIGET